MVIRYTVTGCVLIVESGCLQGFGAQVKAGDPGLPAPTAYAPLRRSVRPSPRWSESVIRMVMLGLYLLADLQLLLAVAL